MYIECKENKYAVVNKKRRKWQLNEHARGLIQEKSQRCDKIINQQKWMKNLYLVVIDILNPI